MCSYGIDRYVVKDGTREDPARVIDSTGRTCNQTDCSLRAQALGKRKLKPMPMGKEVDLTQLPSP
jgi:hypothetical protein